MKSLPLHTLLAFIMLASIPRFARGEGGELTLRVLTGQNMARLDLSEAALRSAKMYLPRLGIQLVYGITHELQTGIEVQASLPSHYSSTTPKIYRGIKGATVVRAYNDVLVAIPFEIRRPRGTPFTLWFEFAPALQITFTKDQLLKIASPPRQVNTPAYSEVGLEFLGQTRAGVEWRPVNALATRVGVDVAGSSAKNFFFGAFLSFDYVLPLGAHL